MSTSTVARTVNAPQARPCPSWCVVDHGDDPIDDIFHRGAHMQIGVPEHRLHLADGDLKLVAHLCLPSAPEPGDEGGFLVVDPGHLFGPYAELDLEHTDQLVRDLKAFTARVEQARDVLAAIKEQQS